MSTVATLTIQMAADLARLQSDMNATKGMVGGAMNDVSRVVDVAKKAFIALGGAASITAFAGAIKGALETSAALTDLSKKTGVSIEALSKFSDVGKLSGTSVEQIADAMTKLSKNFDGTAKVTKEAGAAIKALGLDYNSFLKLSPEDRMTAVAKAMDKFADGSGKTAAAMAIFGKSGAQMIPMMSDLAQAGDLQARITTEQAEAADEFLDNLEKLKISGGQWKNELANGMAPALKVASRAFLDVINGAGGLRDQLGRLNRDGAITEWTKKAIIGITYVMDMMAGVKRVFQTVGESIGGSLAIIGTSVASLAAAARKLLTGDFAGALDEVKSGMSQARTIARDLGATLSDVWSEQTIGQKIRDRIAEIDKMSAAAKEAKPQVDMRAEFEGNAKAAAKEAEELQKIEIYRQKIKEADLEAIEVYRQKIKLTDEQTAAIKAQTEEAAAWQKTIDDVFTGLTDALFRAFEEGKGFMLAFRDTLVNAFKTLVLQPTIQAVMRPVAGVMGGLMSGVGSAVAGTPGAAGGSGGGMLSTLGTLGGLTGMAGMFGSGLGFGLIGGVGGGMGIAGTMGAGASMISGGMAGGMAGLGSTIAGVGAMLGAALPVIAAVYAIWKGFSRGPKKITEQGISGTVVGGDATAQLYEKWKQSGGWIVGDRKGTRYKDLGEEMSAGLDQATAGVYGQIAEWTKAIGLPAEQLAQVTHSISIKLGKTDEETQKNIEAAMEGYRLALASKFSAALEPFRNAGETLVETLQRLVGIQAMSEQLNQFGGVFSRIAQLSIDAREELIGFAGGIENLIGKAQAFVGAYYSEGEQAAMAAKGIRDVLDSLGLATNLTSRSDFRALVESTDVSTTEGRRALDTLLTLAPSFAQVADYLVKNGGSLADLAAQAPQAAVLESMFAASEAQTQYAADTAAGVVAVENAVTASGESIVAAVEGVSARVDQLAQIINDSLARNSRDIVGAIEAMPVPV